MLKTFSGFFYVNNASTPVSVHPTDDSSSIVSISSSGDEEHPSLPAVPTVPESTVEKEPTKEGEIHQVYLVIVDEVPHSVFRTEEAAQQKMKEIADKFAVRENMLPPIPTTTYQEVDGNVLKLYCRYDYFTSCDRLVHQIRYKTMYLEN